MPKYSVHVRVDFNYEVEANNEAVAKEQGWQWEDYKMFSTIYSIDAEEIGEDEEV